MMLATVEVPVIGQRVRQLRMAAGLTQQQLATAAGLSMSLIAQIEQGASADPKMSTARRLARALGVTLDQLADESPLPGVEPEPHAEEPAPVPPPEKKKPRRRKGE